MCNAGAETNIPCCEGERIDEMLWGLRLCGGGRNMQCTKQETNPIELNVAGLPLR